MSYIANMKFKTECLHLIISYLIVNLAMAELQIYMTNVNNNPTSEYITLKEICDKIGIVLRTGHNYVRLMKDNYPEQYEEILQERRLPGKSGKAQKFYKADPGIQYFQNIKDNKPVKEPEAIEIVKEECREEIKRNGYNRQPATISVSYLDNESKEKLVKDICEEYSHNENSIKEICFSMGVRITSFMKLLVANPIFKEMFDEANKIRKHVLVAELEFWEHKTLLDKIKPKTIKTIETIVDLVPKYNDDGTYSIEEVPKARREKDKDYTPTPMTLALAGKKRDEILQEISDGTGQVIIPDFENMTPEERRAKIEALREELKNKQQNKLIN